MSQFEIRPARLSDETAVNALSAQIWEGEDYVPHRFRQWVADEKGQFTVIYERGDLVAFSKLTELRAGEWWLEGLRVAPQHRQRGLARRLHEHAVALADDIGWGVLRFSTTSTKAPVHKLAQETGFRRISQHCIAEVEIDAATADMVGADRFRAVETAELAQLEDYLDRSPHFAASRGLMEHRWILREIKPRLTQLQQDNRLYWWRHAAAGGCGCAIVKPEKEGPFWLNYVDADESQWHALLTALPALAAAAGALKIRSKPATTPTLQQALVSAGWRVDPDKQLWGYERPLAQKKPG